MEKVQISAVRSIAPSARDSQMNSNEFEHWCRQQNYPTQTVDLIEIVHIDHTELDIELRSQATGRLLGRPWLTLLTDAYSRRILAVYLTFDAPS